MQELYKPSLWYYFILFYFEFQNRRNPGSTKTTTTTTSKKLIDWRNIFICSCFFLLKVGTLVGYLTRHFSLSFFTNCWINLKIHFQCIPLTPHVQWGKFFYLIPCWFVRLPTDKEWSVYNFNGRFILTVRDRITTTKSRKLHFKKVINWFAF